MLYANFSSSGGRAKGDWRADNILATPPERHRCYCRPLRGAVKKFAEAFKAKHTKLHYLINNAAVMATPFERTKDGNETQMQANHFSHFLLTGLLMDRLKESAPARIVNHSSSAHGFAKKIRCGAGRWSSPWASMIKREEHGTA